VASRFATTRWSVVLAARDGLGTEAQSALAALCEAYWYPLYAFVRRQGCDAEAARDLTQAYFAQLLEAGYLRNVQPSLGRFRSFLLSSLKHFLSHERDRARALKRGGGATAISIDTENNEARYRSEPADWQTPEEVFERRWALTVLEKALSHLHQEWAGAGKAAQYERLRSYLTGEEPQIPYREVAAELGMNEGTVRGAVLRLRRRLGRLLRDEIAQTVTDPKELDDELRHLLTILGQRRRQSG